MLSASRTAPAAATASCKATHFTKRGGLRHAAGPRPCSAASGATPPAPLRQAAPQRLWRSGGRARLCDWPVGASQEGGSSGDSGGGGSGSEGLLLHHELWLHRFSTQFKRLSSSTVTIDEQSLDALAQGHKLLEEFNAAPAHTKWKLAWAQLAPEGQRQLLEQAGAGDEEDLAAWLADIMADAERKVLASVHPEAASKEHQEWWNSHPLGVQMLLMAAWARQQQLQVAAASQLHSMVSMPGGLADAEALRASVSPEAKMSPAAWGFILAAATIPFGRALWQACAGMGMALQLGSPGPLACTALGIAAGLPLAAVSAMRWADGGLPQLQFLRDIQAQDLEWRMYWAVALSGMMTNTSPAWQMWIAAQQAALFGTLFTVAALSAARQAATRLLCMCSIPFAPQLPTVLAVGLVTLTYAAVAGRKNIYIEQLLQREVAAGPGCDVNEAAGQEHAPEWRDVLPTMGPKAAQLMRETFRRMASDRLHRYKAANAFHFTRQAIETGCLGLLWCLTGGVLAPLAAATCMTVPDTYIALAKLYPATLSTEVLP